MDSSWTYNASFYYKFPSTSSFAGKLTVALQTATGSVLASQSVNVKGSQTSWTHVSLALRPASTASSTNNVFAVTIQSTSGSTATTIDFAMFSLFPPTFKNRSNGMRIDIAEVRVLRHISDRSPTHSCACRPSSRWALSSSASRVATIWYVMADMIFSPSSFDYRRVKLPRPDGNGMPQSDRFWIAPDGSATGVM